MELNDNVRITLTFEGAKHLNEKNTKIKRRLIATGSFNKETLDLLYPESYHDQQVLRGQLYNVFDLFREFPLPPRGVNPFTNLELDDNKGCCCRTGSRVSQIQ